MNKKKFRTTIILFAILFSLVVGVHVAKSNSKTITVPDDYPSIQAAVGHASPGDTVFVRSGNYAGGILIDKPISLIGEDSKTTAIVGGKTASELGLASVALRTTPETSFSAQKTVASAERAPFPFSAKPANLVQPANFIPALTFAVIVNSDNVTISGFKIMGGDRAIYSSQGSGLRIIQNSLGTCIFGGTDNTIANNSRMGLLTVGGYRNTIIGNSGGLTLSSSNSTFMKNSLTYFESEDANYNVFVNNTLTGANMGMWIGSYGKNCSYNIFAGNKIENSGLWGILMGAGSYNVFFGNIVENTGVGIGHDGYGLALGGNGVTAENNLFLRNIFVNNSKNFGVNWPVTGTNSFDDGKEGNCWDDYLTKYPNASETGQSGTGNIPYVLTGNNVDNHPLLRQPSISDKVPALPEPWQSLLPVLLPVPSFWPSTSSNPSPSPTVSILSPENTTYAATGNSFVSVPLTFVTNASLSWVGYSLDGGSNVTASNGTIVEIPIGSQNLTVYANDTTGNWAAPQTVFYSVAWNGGTPPEPFPTLLVAATFVVTFVVVAVVVAGGVLVYWKKHKWCP